MGDSRVRLDPMRVLFHVRNDRIWRSVNPRAIEPNSNWISPNASESLMMEEPETEITVGCVNRQIKAHELHSKGSWKDLALKELQILADGGAITAYSETSRTLKRFIV